MAHGKVNFINDIGRIISQGIVPLYFYYLLVLQIFLSGCSSIGTISKSEDISIRNGQQTIVLLRVTAKVGGKSVDVLEHFGFYLFSIDNNKTFHQGIFSLSPSSESRREGWIYKLLSPGETYYFSPWYLVNMAVDPISRNVPYTTALYPLKPVLRFHLPSNKQIAYIGSFSFTCDGQLNNFDVPQVKSCSELSITDETEAAKSLSRDFYPQYGQPITALTVPWSSAPPTARQYTPLGVASASAGGIVGPSWYKRSLRNTTLFPDYFDFIYDKDPPSFRAAFLPYYILYLPVGGVLGTIGGAHSEGKWQPCIDKLGQECRSSDYPLQLRNKLVSGLHDRGIDTIVQVSVEQDMTEKAIRNGLKAILRADVQQVQFTECAKRWTFRVGSSIRVRIWETATGKYLYDRVFDNSDKALFPYQSLIEGSKCRKIEEYCGEKGINILREDLAKAIDVSVAEVLRDLAP